MIRRPPRSPPLPYTTLFRPTSVCSVCVKQRPASSRTAAAAATNGSAACGRPTAAATSAKPSSDQERPQRKSSRSEEHTSELQSRQYLVCRLLLETKKNTDHQ